jgi:Glycine zipper
MTKTKDKGATDKTKKRVERELEGGAAGALAGAAVGSVAGPPGAIAGAVIGAIAGAVAGRAAEMTDESRAAEDQKLDGEIGVSGGELGAPNLKHPPAKIGAYSGGSAGVGPSSGDEEPAEGPIQPPE